MIANTLRPLVVLFCLLVVPVLNIGCSPQKKVDAFETDASGFQCGSCKLKFFLDGQAYADKCPGCGKETVIDMIAFFCPTDKKTLVVPATASAATCDVCNASVIDKKLPNSAELQSWGAVKKTQQEVTR